jgi:hypothetical protein
MRYVGLVRNVMLGRQGLDHVLLLRLVDAAGGRSAESHLTTGNLTFEAASASPSRSTGGSSRSRSCPCAPPRSTRPGCRGSTDSRSEQG